jgi:hypothetical protein
MKGGDSALQEKCDICGSTNLESSDDMVKCLDCGMGKYKKGHHKGVR